MNMEDIRNGKQRFGLLVRYHRLKQKHTLRSFAKILNISHAYLRKLEMGEAADNQQIFDLFCSHVGFKITNEGIDVKNTLSLIDTVHNSILYLDIQGIQNAIETLQKNHETINQSLLFVEYQLAVFAYQTTHVNVNKQKIIELYQALSGLESLLSEHDKQRFLIYTGNYHYHMGDFNEALKHFEDAKALQVDQGLCALANYLTGLIYAQTFQLLKSNEYLQRATDMFVEQNNDMRVITTYMYKNINNMKMGMIKGIEKSFHDVIGFCETHQLTVFKRQIQNNLLTLYIKECRYEDAVALLEELGYNQPRHVFLRAYIHYLQGDIDEAVAFSNRHINQLSMKNRGELLFVYGAKVLALLREPESDASREVRQRFFDETMRANAYYEIDIAYDFYKTYLVNKRQYKEAYHLALRMIEMTKKAYN